jgi:hypothetical protein
VARSAPALRIARDAIPVRGGRLRLVTVADTHGQPHHAIAERVRALAPDAILHGGDVGELSALRLLEALAPTYAVRGNIDGRPPELPDVRAIDLVDGEQTLTSLLLLHIAVAGPRIRADAARLARAAKASLIVCDHSHVPFLGQDRGLTVFNPGSIGPRRFTLPIVFGVIELAAGRLSLRHVNCVTGETWLPPAC